MNNIDFFDINEFNYLFLIKILLLFYDFTRRQFDKRIRP